MDEKTIILGTDPEAATYQTGLEGWVSRTGRFWGKDERMARYDGSTHRLCNTCKKPIEKHSYCRECHDRKEIEKYNAMPKKEWSGGDGLYSQAHEKYFWSMDEVYDFCEDHECTVESLRLIICTPTYAREIDPQEYYCDDLPEDGGEVPDEIQAAFDELNERIREAKAILCWFPGKFAAIIAEPKP